MMVLGGGQFLMSEVPLYLGTRWIVVNIIYSTGVSRIQEPAPLEGHTLQGYLAITLKWRVGSYALP
jgi:hypothetical protein